MTLSTAILIIAALSFYSFFLVRKSAHVQINSIIPFLFRVHSPNVMELLSKEEHESIHDKIDIFNLRILTCWIASILAIGLSMFFIALVYYESGNPSIVGILMSGLFAYLCVNYNLNSRVVSWIMDVENDLLARIIIKKQEASEFDTLDEYFEAENHKMVADYYESMTKIADEFEEVLLEEGYDPEKDYNATEDDFAGYLKILERASVRMNEKYPEHPEE